MTYVAFTLGILGSLHCIGMCGPLAVAFCTKDNNSTSDKIKSAFFYNIGRTTTYTFLGVLFGIIGSFLLFADLQKTISIVFGVLLVFSFFLSVDIDTSINNSGLLKIYYFRIKGLISRMMMNARNYHPYTLGIANGLLPCGLVYLAIAGAIATGSLFHGALFMFTFGIGTIPAMFALSLGYGLVPGAWKLHFKKVFPVATLCFGLFLIYRGFVVDMPEELNFWEALKNPIMCH